MDIHGYRSGSAPQPAILYVHGGGWETGDRTTGFENRRIAPLVHNGFIVATIDYRLAPRHKHPAQIHDTKCAIKFMRSAKGLGVDGTRIGLMGDSAGGHLSALAGLTTARDNLDGDELAGIDSSVKAVATFYGAFDLVNVEPSLVQHAIPKAFPDLAARYQGSPIVYVDAVDPPFLIVHGKEDRFVDVAQSVKLAMALKDAGHDPLLLVVDKAGHGFVPRGGAPSPDSAVIDNLLTAFFIEHVK